MKPPPPTGMDCIANLFAALAETREGAGDGPGDRPEDGEACETLLETENLRLERIVSHGQATPPGEWLEQERAEWVLLLQGSAGLRFEDEGDVLPLTPGDCVLISPRRRHRVEWTEAGKPTLWLALHYEGS